MSPPRSLTTDLQQWPPQALEQLLRARPDLAVPPPRTVAELAERASSRPSVPLALGGLDAWTLCVAHAMAACQAGGGTASAGELAGVLGLAGHDDEVAAAIAHLTDLALAWGEPPALTSTVRAVLGPYPCGLAPASARPLTSEAVQDGLTAVGEEGMKVLERLVWGPPTGTVRRADRPVSIADAESTMDLLLAHGLLRPTAPDQVVLPREVALRLRRGLYVQQAPSAHAPGWPASDGALGANLDPELLDRAAVGSAQELISHAEVMLDELGTRNPKSLANGEMSKRDLAALARITGEDVDAEPSQSRFVLALVRHTGMLVARSRTWLATTAYDDFLALPGYGRWRALATAWADLGWWPDRTEPRAAALRAAALAELAAAEPGTAVDEGSLAGRLAWRRPGLVGAEHQELWPRFAAELIAEARWLGLLAFDRTSALVRAVDDPTLPDPGFAGLGDSLLLQSDLTAVAPAPLDHDTARAIGELAERESHGAAAAFRFTGPSLRRGLDAGWSADTIADWLREHNAEGPDAPLPGSLSALIADTARTHGTVRIVQVGAIVHVADPAAAAAILAGSDASELGLRELAPGLIASDAEPAELVAALRAAGHAPVAERPSGDRYTTPAPRRAPAPAPAPAPRPVDLVRLAGALAQKASDGMSAEQILNALTRAYNADSWVDVDWVDDDGAPQSRSMRVLSMSAGVAHMVRRAAGRISLPLTRIVSVGPVPADGNRGPVPAGSGT